MHTHAHIHTHRAHTQAHTLASHTPGTTYLHINSPATHPIQQPEGHAAAHLDAEFGSTPEDVKLSEATKVADESTLKMETAGATNVNVKNVPSDLSMDA